MCTCEKLVEIITGQYSIDYWYEDVSLYAKSLLTEFNDNDWMKINTKCNLMTVNEKIRLSEILSVAPSDRAVPLLSQLLLESVDYELTESAIESLRCIGDGESIIAISSDLFSKLKILATKQSGILSKTLPLLMKRLESN